MTGRSARSSAAVRMRAASCSWKASSGLAWISWLTARSSADIASIMAQVSRFSAAASVILLSPRLGVSLARFERVFHRGGEGKKGKKDSRGDAEARRREGFCTRRREDAKQGRRQEGIHAEAQRRRGACMRGRHPFPFARDCFCRAKPGKKENSACESLMRLLRIAAPLRLCASARKKPFLRLARRGAAGYCERSGGSGGQRWNISIRTG